MNKKNMCISCGMTSQRSGKSWELWNQCANCAKRSNPEFYRVMKCSECGATSNNTSALCWKLYNKCGKCAYRIPEHRRHTLCKECNEVCYKLRYYKLRTHSIDLFYCTKCSGIITREGHRIFLMKGVVQMQ